MGGGLLQPDSCPLIVAIDPDAGGIRPRFNFKKNRLQRRDGFTLIEILVAISILAISLVVIMQLFSGGLKSSSLSDKYVRAIFHAREKMEEILVLGVISEGELEGDFDDSYRWKTEIILIPSAEEEESKLPYDTFDLKVDVIWNEGKKEKRFTVRTLKVVEKEKGDEPEK